MWQPDLPTRPVGDPRPGWFKMKLVRGGPYVPARIIYGPPKDPVTGGIMEERSYMWEAWVDGKLIRQPSPDPTKAGVFQIWHSGTEISQQEFEFMSADAGWARKYAPYEPIAAPSKPVELGELPPEYFLPRR